MKTSVHSVHSLYSIILALGIAVSVVACVASTSNQEGIWGYMNNSALTSKVKSTLMANPTVKYLPITVTSCSGIVQLSGVVESAAQEQMAVKIAASVPGVTKVEDHLVMGHYTARQ